MQKNGTAYAVPQPVEKVQQTLGLFAYMWYNKNNNPGKARNIRASGVVCY